MLRSAWLLVGLLAVGCGTPVAPPAESSAGNSRPVADEMVVEVDVTPVAFNVTGAPVLELKAPGMDCEACAASIVMAIREKPGVIDVKADAETKVVTVAIKDDEFESDFAIEAVAEAGFGEATILETKLEEEETDATDAIDDSEEEAEAS